MRSAGIYPALFHFYQYLTILLLPIKKEKQSVIIR